MDQDPTSGASRSRTMDRKCQIGQNWRRPRRKLTTARGGLQVDPQNKSGRDCLSKLTLKKGFRWTNQGNDTETIVLLDIPPFPLGMIHLCEQTGHFLPKAISFKRWSFCYTLLFMTPSFKQIQKSLKGSAY